MDAIGRPQVVARPGDELAARVEELLHVGGHRVERAPELAQLLRARPPARAPRSPAAICAEVSCSRSMRRTIDAPTSAAATTAASAADRRDLEDLHVVAHVEHDEPGEEHRRRAAADRDEREPRELEPQRRQEPQRVRRHEPRAERRPDDDERELGHGTSL